MSSLFAPTSLILLGSDVTWAMVKPVLLRAFLCVEVEEVVGVLTPFGGGVAQVFHVLLVELRLLLVAEVEEGDRQEEGWEVREWSRSSQREATMWMTMDGGEKCSELEP